MKKSATQKTLPGLLFMIFLTLFYISCKKNNNSDANLDPVIKNAKAWYESTYPSNQNVVSAAGSNEVVQNRDLNQYIKPDWQNPSVYKKFDSDVIEMDIDPSNKLNSVLKSSTLNKLISNKAYSRSSYILLKNGASYEAYIMTLIADSSYIKNDPAKLARNTYKKRDGDFSGLVLYFTPKGKYVNGYRYKDGQLVNPKSKAGNSNAVTQSINDDNVTKINYEAPECYDYYVVYYTNGVESGSSYLFTLCGTTGGGDGGNGSIGNGGGGGGDGGVSSPTPPSQPCDGPAPRTNSSAVVNSAPADPAPGDGGGFPAPVPCNTIKGSHAAQNAFNAKIDQTSLSPCFKQVLASLQRIDKYCMPNMVAVFAGTTPDYNWIMKDGAFDPINNGTTSNLYDKATGSVTTTFNSPNYRSGTDLAIAKTILHESVHAFLVAYFNVSYDSAKMTYSQYADAYLRSANPDMNALQHDQMVAGFIGSVGSNLREYGKSQGYSAPDQYYFDLAWGGLTDTSAFKNLPVNVQARIMDVILTEQTGTDSNGNTVTQVGKKSGC